LDLASLGGMMMFENIQLLADKWLTADYSDGHVSVRTIYSYKLNHYGLKVHRFGWQTESLQDCNTYLLAKNYTN
jgi:hypothetical protein